MASDGEVYAASPAEVMADAPKKRKDKKSAKKAEKLPADPAPSKAVSLPTTEGGDQGQEDLPTDVTPGLEWIEKVEIARRAVEVHGYRLNEFEDDYKTLKETLFEENENIRKDIDDLRAGEEEAHASLEKKIEALEGKFMGLLETMNAEIKELRKAIQQGRLVAPAEEREDKIVAPKPPTFKGARDAQEVENFLWHVEKYFKYNKVSSEDAKIDTAVLHLDEMALLWWRRKDAEIEKGLCTIRTWEQFKAEFKKAFYPNNVVQEARRKLRELRQRGSMKAYIKEFTTLTLQIPDLSDEVLLFFFTDGLQSWARKELERRQVSTLDEAIAQAEALTDAPRERHRGEDSKGSHDQGGGDGGRGRDWQPRPKYNDYGRPADRRSGRQGNEEGKAHPKKEPKCFMCQGPHHYSKCPEMKNLGAILQQWKEQKAQAKEETESGEDSDTTHLGLIRLCGSITRQPEKPRENQAQVVDIMINGHPARAMVDTGAEPNIITKSAAAKLGLKYGPSRAQLKSANAPATPVCGVAQGVKIALGDWHGKSDFHIAQVDIFDVILGQDFFQKNPVMISPYFQQLIVMEKGVASMVPMVPMSKPAGPAQLSILQLVKDPQEEGIESCARPAKRRQKRTRRRKPRGTKTSQQQQQQASGKELHQQQCAEVVALLGGGE